MQPKQLVLAALLTGLAPTPANALDLTLEQAIERASAASPDLAAARSRIAAAEARIDESSALLSSNPFFSVSMFATTDERIVNNVEQGIDPSLSFSLSQTFELAGQRSKRIELARNNLAVVAANANGSDQALTMAVQQAFFGTIEARERSRFAYELLHWQRELDKAYRQSSKTSQNDSRIRIARAESSYAAEQLNLFEQQSELRRLTGIEADGDVRLVGELPEDVEVIPPLDVLLAFARSQRADVAAHRSSLASGESYVSLLQRSTVPSVTLSGFLTSSDDTGNDDLQYGASVSFPLPVFQTGAAEVRGAVAERERAAAELTDTVSVADQQVRQARFAFANAALDLVRVRDEILPRAEENLTLRNTAFDRGTIGLWELITAEMDAVYARRELVSAQRTYVSARLELERSIGGKLADVPFETTDTTVPERP